MKEPEAKYLAEEASQTLLLLKETAEQECDTNDKWQLRRGQIQAFNFILNLPILLENRLQFLVEQKATQEAEANGEVDYD